MRRAIIFLCLLSAFAIFAARPAWAAGTSETKICGDYQYTPLPGYKIVDGVIRTDTSYIYLNRYPKRVTKKDVKTPTIFCLTEKNDGNFEHRLSKGRKLEGRTNTKDDHHYRIVEADCLEFNNMCIYILGDTFFMSKNFIHAVVVIEVNEEGNEFDAVFAIYPGALEEKFIPSYHTPGAKERKISRMYAWARELASTIKKR